MPETWDSGDSGISNINRHFRTTTTLSNSPTTVGEPPDLTTALTCWGTAIRALTTHAYSLKQSSQSPELRLDDDATRHLHTFRAWLEPRLHPHTGDLASIADWGSKLPGIAVRIAAALTLLDNPHATHITGDTMRDATRLATAYIPHTQRVLDTIRGYGDGLDNARDLVQVIRRKNWATFTLRDLVQVIRNSSWVKGGKGAAADVVAAELETLIDYGYIRPLPEQHTGPGRKPSPRFEVNPAIRKDTP